MADASIPVTVRVDDIIDDAVRAGIATADPKEIGDHGLGFVVPDGYRLDTVDVRRFESLSRRIAVNHHFIDVESLATYVDRHADQRTMVYGHEPQTVDLAVDLPLIAVVLDDHFGNDTLTSDGERVQPREHVARLVLRPTVQARRWAAVLGGTKLTQETFLDLIDDGIGEIAEPDGATLRDLVANLHAIRSSSVTSVVRNGGGSSLTLTDNVDLRAGKGSVVEVPDSMTVTFVPWKLDGCPPIVATVKIKPRVMDRGVVFALESADAGLALGDARDVIAEKVATALDAPILWTA